MFQVVRNKMDLNRTDIIIIVRPKINSRLVAATVATFRSIKSIEDASDGH